MIRRIIAGIIIVVVLLCGGCSSSGRGRELVKQKWDKASGRIKLSLAQQQYELGQYDKAAEAIVGCIQADPSNPLAHLLYGQVLLAQGRRSAAEEELTFAVGLDEELDRGWYWLGVATEQARDYVQAESYYAKALMLSPQTVDYILAVADVQVALGKYEEAQELLEGKMAALPGELSLKMAGADLMLRGGDSKGAAKLYSQAMLLSPGDMEIAEALGYCHIVGRQWQEAAKVFESLLDESSEVEKKRAYLQLLFMCNMNSRRYEKALSFYGRLGASERENPDFWLELGQAALGAGAEKRAFVCSGRALALRPGWGDAIALRGCAAYMAGDYAGAAQILSSLASDPDNGHLSWMIRGRCYEQLGRNKQAEEAFERARQIKPESKLVELLADKTKIYSR